MKILLRFLISGDLQCHNWKQFSHIREDGINSRLFNILSVFDKMKFYALKHSINKALLNGDIFEESDYHLTEIFNAVYRKVVEMREAGMKIAFNLGNHDILRWLMDKVIPVHTLVPFEHIANVIQQPSVLWNHLCVVPYMPAENVKRAVKWHLDVFPYPNTVLVFHGGVQGARAGPKRYLVRNPLKLKDLQPKEWKLILLSDYHTTQYLRDNVLYIGSPVQHSFGETHVPGFWDVTLYDKEPWFKLKHVKTNLPRFIEISVSSMKELKDAEEKIKGNYVRINLKKEDFVEEAESFATKICAAVTTRTSQSEKEVTDSARIGAWELSPSQCIQNYVKKTSSEKRKALIRLGQALYEGKIDG